MNDMLVTVTPDVSVIIVTWNSARYIVECLESLDRWTRTTTFEVIVVDNASSDNTVSAVRTRFPAVRLIENGANRGFAAAANRGIGAAKGRFVFLLNPDTRCESDVLAELGGIFVDCPDAGAAGPQMVDAEGRLIDFAARRFPSVLGAFCTLFGLRKLAPRIFGYDTLACGGSRPVRVPCLTGAALLVPASVLRLTGPLDERLPMYFEDMDICARISAAGLRLYYVPSAVLTHRGGRSAALFPARRFLLAMEKAHAPWFFVANYDGAWSAALFRAVVLGAGLFRLLAIGPALLLAAVLGGDWPARLVAQARLGAALLWWAVTPAGQFTRRVARHFSLHVG